jgi:DNA adenine methylase
VLRDDTSAARLIKQLRLTPFARGEFEGAREFGAATGDPVELARQLIVRSFMGFGSNAHNGRSSGFRSNSRRSGTTPALDFAGYPEALPALIERLRGVIIENRDALAVMAAHDGPDTLHYVDPPYMPETRSPAKYDLKYRMYRYELDAACHAQLVDELQRLRGLVVVSGYACPLYDARLQHWRRVETRTPTAPGLVPSAVAQPDLCRTARCRTWCRSVRCAGGGCRVTAPLSLSPVFFKGNEHEWKVKKAGDGLHEHRRSPSQATRCQAGDQGAN